MRDQSQIDDMRAAIRGDLERSRARRAAEGGEPQPEPMRPAAPEPEPVAIRSPEPAPEPEPEPEAVHTAEPELPAEPVEPIPALEAEPEPARVEELLARPSLLRRLFGRR